MFKRIVMSFVLLGLLVAGVLAQAQDATPLELGEIGEGELTSTGLEISYTITAAEGDFILVEMRSATDSGLYSPALRVLDAEGDELADSTDEITSRVSRVAFVAPADGDYTVVATRGEYSSDTGTFLVRAMMLETLESGTTVSSNVSNETYDSYYAIPSDTVLDLAYVQTDGDYIPTFQVALVDGDGVLRTIATAGALSGIGLSASLETDDDYTYVVAVVASGGDYEYQEIDSDFDLTMTVSE
jgi:hypothetical protein